MIAKNIEITATIKAENAITEKIDTPSPPPLLRKTCYVLNVWDSIIVILLLRSHVNNKEEKHRADGCMTHSYDEIERINGSCDDSLCESRIHSSHEREKRLCRENPLVLK